jgi:hypothetical protein
MSQKLGHRPEEAADVIGSRELLENMRRAGWIAPIYEEKRLTIYSSLK